jgi:hypothetical protein
MIVIPVQFQDLDLKSRAEGAECINIHEHAEVPPFLKTKALKEDGYI